jgi:hypothetical protein
VTFALGWITLFMGDMGEGALHEEESQYFQTKKINIWSFVPQGAQHQHEIADWPSVAI